METFEYYKLIRNKVQLHKVELLSMNCFKQDQVKKDKQEVQIAFHRNINALSDDKIEIILKSRIGIEEGLFQFDITYKGICFSTDKSISRVQLEQYAYDQVVPLLLPYVRECVASTMARMGLPIFTLPTMDILDAIEANLTSTEDQE